MQTDHIHYVAELSRTLSINKTARSLHLAPSYLSKVLKGVEGELGVKLFSRSHEGLSPTEQGSRALDVLSNIDLAFQSILPHSNGDSLASESNVAGEYYLYCRPAITDTKLHLLYKNTADRFPNISLQFVESCEKCTVEAVAKSSHILGLIVHDSEVVLTVPENVVVIRNVFQTRLGVILSKSHPLAKNKSISILRAIKEELVFYDKYSSIADNCIVDLMSKYGDLNIRYIIENLGTFVSVLKETRCITIAAQDGSYDDDLTILPMRDAPSVCYSLVFNKEDLNSPVVQSLVSFVRESLTAKN